MHLWEVVLISIGVSLGPLTIAIMKGANQRQFPKHILVLISIFLGGIQAFILALGRMIGLVPMRYLNHKVIIEANKWIAAIILLALGIKMLRNTQKLIHLEERLEASLNYKDIIILAARSGLDVLLLGNVFGFLEAPISSVYILFIIVSLFVGIGLWIGERFGNKYQLLLNSCSGMILIAMSIEVVISFFDMRGI